MYPLGGMLVIVEAVQMGAGGIRETSVPSSQFYCESKTALLKKYLDKNNWQH